MAKAERLSPACAPQSACVERLAKPSAGAGSAAASAAPGSAVPARMRCQIFV